MSRRGGLLLGLHVASIWYRLCHADLLGCDMVKSGPAWTEPDPGPHLLALDPTRGRSCSYFTRPDPLLVTLNAITPTCLYKRRSKAAPVGYNASKSGLGSGLKRAETVLGQPGCQAESESRTFRPDRIECDRGRSCLS